MREAARRDLSNRGLSPLIATPTPEVMHFSTDALPERDRMTVWREVFGRRILKTEIEPVGGAAFRHETTFRSLPGLSLAFCDASGFRSTRTQSLLADSNDDLILTINTEGVTHASQFGREVRAEAFDGVILCGAERAHFTVSAPARFIIITVPRKPIAAVVGDPEAAASRLLRKELAPLRALSSYVLLAHDDLAFSNPQLRRLFITHVYDLVTLAFGGEGDAARLAEHRGLRAARRAEVLRLIETRSGDSTLSAVAIAKELGVTSRYVHLLLEETGQSFSHHLLQRRLEKAAALLRDPAWQACRIADVALQVGFTDLSNFSRAFRHRYGVTPTDMRTAATREAAQ
jgi:AraC-like DNA-binding protein